MVLDMIASKVSGAAIARDCRVVWTEGVLYVCKSPADIQTFECERPKKVAGSWTAHVGEAVVRWQPPGCGSCRRRVMQSPVGQMSVDEIAASVQSVDA